MTYRWDVSSRIARARVIAIIRTDTAEQAIEAAESVIVGGLEVVEIAFTTPGACSVLESLARNSSPDTLIGAGTILDAETARLALLAGAQFLVSPGLFESVLRTGHRYGVATIPGTSSVTEVAAALEMGAEMVKVFPAQVLGFAHIKAIAQVLPQAGLVPTGGIGLNNARVWLESGAVAVGCGGDLIQRDRASTISRARKLAAMVQRD